MQHYFICTIWQLMVNFAVDFFLYSPNCHVSQSHVAAHLLPLDQPHHQGGEATTGICAWQIAQSLSELYLHCDDRSPQQKKSIAQGPRQDPMRKPFDVLKW